MSRWLSIVVVLIALTPIPTYAQSSDQVCFAETGQCISGRIRQYWEQNGGIPVFGFPISAAQIEFNSDSRMNVLTQWFERNRLEVHPQNDPPYDVLLGRLGDDGLREKGIAWRDIPRATPLNGCLYFAETGHNICDQDNGLGFLAYWRGHGLLDAALSDIQRSIALFGLPLSEPGEEVNSSGDRVLTQWFERARLEWHPNNQNEYKVLLGLLGRELRRPSVVPGSPEYNEFRVEGAISIRRLSSTTVQIMWKTGVPATSEVWYGLTRDYGLKAGSTAFTLEHATILTSLQTTRIYHYRIASRNQSGRLINDVDHTFCPTLTGCR